MHGDRGRSSGVFESLDVDAIYVFKGVLSECHRLALSGEAVFQKGSIYLTKLSRGKQRTEE